MEAAILLCQSAVLNRDLRHIGQDVLACASAKIAGTPLATWPGDHPLVPGGNHPQDTPVQPPDRGIAPWIRVRTGEIRRSRS